MSDKTDRPSRNMTLRSAIVVNPINHERVLITFHLVANIRYLKNDLLIYQTQATEKFKRILKGFCSVSFHVCGFILRKKVDKI